MAESGLKVPKEEKTSISESIQDITFIFYVLNSGMTFSLAEDTKFIQKENTEKMYDILKELDKIEFDFNELE